MKLRFVMIAMVLALSAKAFASNWSDVTYTNENLDESSSGISDPIYQRVYDSVNQTSLQTFLRESTGSLPVVINGQSILITDRYLPASKAKFRAYFAAYFQSLGIPVQEMAYTTKHHIGESQGHNMEAILAGKTSDSIVIIVHYDSIGPSGQEANNPGVDDDMSGMAVLFETARILAANRDKLQHTVRFVAADYEEHAFPGLEGARHYAAYLKDLALKSNFKIVAAVDDEQIGWNCATDRRCGDASQGDTFDVFSCGGQYNFQQMGDALAQVAATYSTMKVKRGCMGANSDHYAMWEIGVPAVVFSEHSPFNNPHFDQNGGDSYDKIDQTYFFKIAKIGVTFAATLAGLQ